MRLAFGIDVTMIASRFDLNLPWSEPALIVVHTLSNVLTAFSSSDLQNPRMAFVLTVA